MLIVSLIALTAAQLGQPASRSIYGVAHARDGDSLEVNGAAVRLYGIDAPELHQRCMRDGVNWACGAEAAGRLARLVSGRAVRCEPMSLDQFDRVVARCSVGSLDVNRAMVELGFAVAFRRYASDYIAAEGRAKTARLGIWAGSFELPETVRARTQTKPVPRRERPARAVAQHRAQSPSGCVIKGNQSRRGEWIYHVPGMPYYA